MQFISMWHAPLLGAGRFYLGQNSKNFHSKNETEIRPWVMNMNVECCGKMHFSSIMHIYSYVSNIFLYRYFINIRHIYFNMYKSRGEMCLTNKINNSPWVFEHHWLALSVSLDYTSCYCHVINKHVILPHLFIYFRNTEQHLIFSSFIQRNRRTSSRCIWEIAAM